jgi:hypothetical protein
MKSLLLVKVMALIISESIAANSATVTTTDTLAYNSSACEQIMTISCHDCHENFDADISASHATCPHCGHCNEFDG